MVRENRFRARILLRGEEVAAHVPNSGRLTELLAPGQPLLVREARARHRLTDFDILMVRLGEALVSVDARLPNALFGEALEAGALPEFRGLKLERREVKIGTSRLDFLLHDDLSCQRCLAEVKSVTLVQQGVALFPDAVTERGRRHLTELRRALSGGLRAAVVFVIQRGDASHFAPHYDPDPAFASELQDAAAAGVEVYAYGCRVTPEEVALDYSVPVDLSSGQRVGPRTG